MALGLLAPPAGAAQAEGGFAGFVVAVEGRWRLLGTQRELKLGDMLPGAAVVEASPGQTSKLKIGVAPLPPEVTRGGMSAGAPLALECANAASCGLLTLPPAPPAESAWGRLADAVGAVLGRNYRHYRTTLARTLERVPQLREAVVSLDSGILDLGPALEHVSAGTYQVELLPAPDPGEAAPTTARLAWRPGEPALLAPAGARPGLYELSLALPAPDAPAGRAWVWACTRATVDACRARFAPAAALAASFDGSGDPGVLRSFLRSALEHLATSEP